MQINFENLTIGVFAKAAGVNVETIRESMKNLGAAIE